MRAIYKEYAIEAFRYYALCGKPNAAEIATRPVEHGAQADLMAVASLIESLEVMPDAPIWRRCLDIVYFSDPRRRLQRGAVTNRVLFAALELSISERTVYRIMQQLQRKFAQLRGLRVSE